MNHLEQNLYRDKIFILFDCMETLIDMTEIPVQVEYALWAYEGCGFENLWKGFHEFLEGYNIAKSILDDKNSKYTEYDILEIFKLIVSFMNLKDISQKVIDSLYVNYWNNYSKRCYVSQETRVILQKLLKRYKMGVVSNFKVHNGVEKLLEANKINSYFDFVITSIKFGFRKPCKKIYYHAAIKTKEDFDKIIFIGDDLKCDYLGPRKIGIKSILYDSKGMHIGIKERISCLSELELFL